MNELMKYPTVVLAKEADVVLAVDAAIKAGYVYTGVGMNVVMDVLKNDLMRHGIVYLYLRPALARFSWTYKTHVVASRAYLLVNSIKHAISYANAQRALMKLPPTLAALPVR